MAKHFFIVDIELASIPNIIRTSAFSIATTQKANASIFNKSNGGLDG